MFPLQIQYLCDENGTKTAVLLPINEWDSLLKEYQLLKEKKPIHLLSTTYYPSEWDDLIDAESRELLISIFTVSSLEDLSDDEIIETGISRADDGIIDIVVEAEMLTEEIVSEQLHKLSKLMRVEYLLQKE